MYRATPDVGAKTLYYETALLVPDDMTTKAAAPSFMYRILAAHAIKGVTEEVTNTVVESDSKAPEYKKQPLSKSVFRL